MHVKPTWYSPKGQWVQYTLNLIEKQIYKIWTSFEIASKRQEWQQHINVDPIKDKGFHSSLWKTRLRNMNEKEPFNECESHSRKTGRSRNTILTAHQPVSGYFMPKDVVLNYIYIFLYSCFLRDFFFWHTVKWYQVFLSNTNNLHTVVGFQVFQSNTNNLHTVVGFQVFLFNSHFSFFV